MTCASGPGQCRLWFTQRGLDRGSLLVDPFLWGDPIEQTCPACQLAWRPWYNAPRRRYQEFLDLCPPCYVRKTAARCHREARARAKLPIPTVTKREMAPWLVSHPELYRGPKAGSRSRQQGSRRSPEQRRAAVPAGMGGESHGEFILQPSVGRHVPHRAAAI